jgi:NADH:ubiquinone oxidoreductase subunit 4 (subunit M)
MILPWVAAIFLIGAVLAWVSGRLGPRWPRWVSLFVLVGHLGLLLVLWAQHVREVELTGAGPWLLRYSVAWIAALNVRFSLGLDGVSLLLVVPIALVGWYLLKIISGGEE